MRANGTAIAPRVSGRRKDNEHMTALFGDRAFTSMSRADIGA